MTYLLYVNGQEYEYSTLRERNRAIAEFVNLGYGEMSTAEEAT